MKNPDKNKFINIYLSRDDDDHGEDELLLTEFKSAKMKDSSLRTEKTNKTQELKMELVSNISDSADNKIKNREHTALNAGERQNKSKKRNTKEKTKNRATKINEAKKSESLKKANSSDKSNSKEKKARDKNKISKAKHIMLFILALLFISFMVFIAYWFIRADEIIVDGNETISDEAIITLSGISKGDNYFTIDKGACKRGIESATKLDYLGMEYDLSGVLTIKVYERKEAAQLKVSDNDYIIIDNEGIVLDNSSIRANYPLITGIGVNEYVLGYAVRTDDSSKFEKIATILYELEAHYLIDEISQIDLTDLTAVTMITNNGIEIDFGESSSKEEVCGKSTWIQSVLPELYKSGYTSGTLNVKSEKTITFLPKDDHGGGKAEVILSDIGEAVVPHG